MGCCAVQLAKLAFDMINNRLGRMNMAAVMPKLIVINNSKYLKIRTSGLSLPFWGMGPGPLALGKLAAFRLKLGK